MRVLMWLVLGFAGGCGVGIWLFGGHLLIICAAILLFGGVLAYFLGGAPVKRKLLGLVCIGCSVGMLWLTLYDHFTLSVPRAYEGQTLELVIEASDYSCQSYDGTVTDGETVLGGQSCRVMFYMDTPHVLKPGDVVLGEFYLRYTGIRGRSSSTYHQGKGISLLAYPVGEVRIFEGDAVPGRFFAAELRHNILKLLDEIFPEDTLGFARALLLGDSSKLSLEQDKAFQASGIRHIIAVSGLHVSVLFSLIQVVMRKRRVLSGLVGLPVLLLFAAVAGFTPSTVRACVMHAVMILASIGRKEYDPPTSLSVAVLVILLWNPLALASVSFQLSVGCIVGILAFSRKPIAFLRGKLVPEGIKRRCVGDKLLNWFIHSVAITLSTMSTTLPLSAYYFGSISLVSVISNLLTLWLVSVCFYGIVFSCLLGAVIPAAGALLGWLVSWLLRLVCLLARILAAVPFACVSTHNVYVAAWLVFTYATLFLFFVMGRKRPVLMGACILTALAVSLTLSSLERVTERFRVTVLDVGQGQCVILQSGWDCYLVDCGGDFPESAGDMAAQTLKSQGITSVNGVILTHFDTDHAGGAEAFMAQLPVQSLYIPDAEDHNGILAQLRKTHEPILQPVTRATTLPCGEGTVTLYPAQPGTSGNESSLCILFQVENYDILITGDRSTEGEEQLLESYSIPDLEVLVVGHHGAASSTGMAFLQKTRPNVAVISVGADNSYGHPSEEALERLRMYDCVILRTDESGTITFRG